MNESTLQNALKRLNFSFRRQVPQILQSEASECGLACIAMVSSYYGAHIDLFNLRQQYGISSQGATLSDLTEIADELKFQTRPLSLDLHELKELKTPCILHWDFNHFVVLVGNSRGKYIIQDPALGKRTLTEQEISPHFTGVALELWPRDDFQKMDVQTHLSFRTMLTHVIGLPSALIKIFCYSLLIEAINLLLPVGTQLVMDHVIIAEDHHLLAIICIGLLSFTLFRGFLGIIRSWVSLVIGALINIQWKVNLFDHLLKLPLTYFEKRKLGDIQMRFGSLDVVRTTLTTGLVSGIVDSIMTIGLLLMMFLYGGWLVWVVLAFTIIYMLLRFATYRYYREVSEENIVKNSKAMSYFMETLYGMGTLKALGLSSMRAKQWLNLNIDTSNTNIKMTRFDMLFQGTNLLISTIDQVVILWIGAMAVIDGFFSLGMFIAFNAYRGQFSDRAANLINLVLQFKMLSLHSDRLSDIVFTEKEESLPHRQLTKLAVPAEFQMKDVTFQYDVRSEPVISNFNMKVKAGESVAIVGPSGVGKTTLMKIMTGLVKPTEGTIFFNDVDIYQAGLNNYRQHIACVLQEDKLFSGSIADNICSFADHKELERMIACVQLCNMHDDIMAMPMGYETMLSELGGGLSGGQKQRLLIARALYRQPSILFLDEATSHLDLDNEAKINKAIASLQITRIFIAHRPSTIKSADRQIHLDADSMRNRPSEE